MTTILSIEEILDRGRRERARTAYPEGFPVLPPVPAGRYADAGFAALDANTSSNRAGCSWPTPTSWPNRATTSCCANCRNRSCSYADTTARFAPCSTPANIAAVRSCPTTPATPGGGWSAATTPGPTTSTATLVGLPGAQDFQVDTACLGLPPVRCEAWGSLVFVNLDSDAPPLLDALGVVGRELHDQIGGGDGVGPVHLVGRRSIEVDGQLEAHGRRQHRDVPRQHRPPDQRRRRPRPGGDRHLPLPRRTFPDARAQSRRQERSRSTCPAFPVPAPWRTAGSTRSTCSPTRASCSAGSPALAFLISSWPVGPDRSLYDVHFLAATPADGPHGPTPRRPGRSELGGAARRPRQPRRHPALRRRAAD